MSEKPKVYGSKDYGDLLRSLVDIWPAKYQKPIRLLIEDIIKMFPHEIEEKENGFGIWEINNDIQFYTQSQGCNEFIYGFFTLKDLKCEIYINDPIYGESDDIEHLDSLQDIHQTILYYLDTIPKPKMPIEEIEYEFE
jgi:hypothetical protein